VNLANRNEYWADSSKQGDQGSESQIALQIFSYAHSLNICTHNLPSSNGHITQILEKRIKKKTIGNYTIIYN
jgi:hypothetical protein